MTTYGRLEINGYREVTELGTGASGRVVAAVHEASGRLVAMKFLSRDLLELDRFVTRFRAEARLLESLDHPNLVRFYEYVETDDAAVIIMELVEGGSLRALLEREGAAGGPVAALTVLYGSLRGLAAAHQAGVVHRDYKPENVLVAPNGVSKLTDFGIAVAAGAGGGISGTPAYMAPEQWLGRPADPTTDVYAATAVFFECLTGHRPYTGDNKFQLAAAHRSAPIPLDQVPAALRPLIARGLAKTPEHRPTSATVFLQEVGQVARDSYGPDWETIGLTALATAAATLIGAGAATLVTSAGVTSSAASTASATSTATTTATSTTTSTATRTTLRRTVLKTARGKAAAGLTAVAVIGAAVVGVLLVSAKPHKPVAAPVVAPQVNEHIVLANAPLTPLTGNAALYHPPAHYPQLSGMPNQALQNRINTEIQQPSVDWATFISNAAADHAKYSTPIAPGTDLKAVQTVTIVQAGALLSITYKGNGGLFANGTAAKILVIRLDTGEPVTPNMILTSQGLSTTGSGRIAEAVNAANPDFSGRGCRPLTAQDIQGAFTTQPTMNVLVGVTPTGINVWAGPESSDCAAKPVVVPYSQLTGTVSPLVLGLVSAHQPRIAQR